MALSPSPAFVGKITISSRNNKLYWREDDGSVYDLSITIPDGEYWPDDLCTTITTQMDLESDNSGAINTYAVTFDVATGKYTFARITGDATFYLKATLAETSNILTGGGVDDYSNALSAGQWGPNALGWVVESGYPALGSVAVSERQSQHYWLAPYAPQTDDDGDNYESTNTQVVTISGRTRTYDFSGWKVSRDEHPLHGGYFRKGRITIEYVETVDKHAWIYQFWGPYGKAGETFRYYEDHTDNTSHRLYTLMAPSIDGHGFDERLDSNQWWLGTIHMHRVAS